MTAIWIIALAICVLIIASAFFSSAETALTAASDARMHQLARNGNRRAALVESLRADREALIGTLLIGNNAVNVLASALATSAAIALFGDSGVFVATAAMTVILVLLAEVLPKSYAFNNANRYALRIAPLVKFCFWLLLPLSVAVRWLAIKLLGPGSTEEQTDEEELRGMIALQGRGQADAHDRERNAMLASVLDLQEISVDQIMTHRGSVSMVNADEPAEAVLRAVLTSPFTRHPVYAGKPENIIGVLHVKSLLRAIEGSAERDMDNLDIAAIASQPYFVPETTALFDQLQAFRTRREHFAIVVDEYGDFRGIVTLEDILEEIVGDIDDEHDEELAGLSPQPDGSLIVDGNVTIRDLNRALGLELPDDQAATLAGLLIYESRTIPVSGQEFRFHDIRFRVIRRQGNQITSLRLWTGKAQRKNRGPAKSAKGDQ